MKNKILIIDCGSNKTEHIEAIADKNYLTTEKWYLYYPTIDFKLNLKDKPKKICLVKIENNKVITTTFNKDFIKKIDAVILSGGGLIINIQADIKKFFKELITIKIPVLGICFGHQVIGLVFGSEIYNLGKTVSGSQKIHFIKNSKLVSNDYLTANKYFEQNHTEAIHLPNDFDLIAKSDICNNEMMQHKSKNIFGVQFHPEVSGVDGEKIIHNFLQLLS